MRNLLPLPTIDQVPAALRGDPDIQAYCTFLDAEFQRWFDAAAGLDKLKDPARTPEVTLNAFGEWLSAGIRESDDERTKRSKISNASDNLRYLSTWKFSAKPMIDAHVGGDAKIVSGLKGDDMVLCGSADDPVDFFWFALGGLDIDAEYGTRLVGGAGIVQYVSDVITRQEDQMILRGIDTDANEFSFALGGLDVAEDYGTRLLGDGTEFDVSTTDYVEPMIKGTILVDVDNPSLSEADLAALKLDLSEIAPAYFKVYLGYVVDEVFIPYTNGLVGE